MRTTGAFSEALFLIAILKRIPERAKISTTELAQGLEADGYNASPRRLQRALKAIVEAGDFGVECDTSSKPYGYRRRRPGSDLTAVQLTPQESLLLRLADENLRYQLPGHVISNMRPLFDKAAATLNEGDPLTAQWMQKVCVVPDGVRLCHPDILPRLFDAVSEALFTETQLRLTYTAISDETATPRVLTVSPLGLVQQNRRLYLVCAGEDGKVRHLAMHRLQAAELLAFPAVRPVGFTLASYVASRHFNYSNGDRCRLTLVFRSSLFARQMTETPFTGGQTLERQDDGTWRLTAVTDDSVQLDGWLAAWRDSAGFVSVTCEPLGSAVS